MKARAIRVRREENSWLAGMRMKASAERFPLDKRWRNYAQGQRRISFIKLIRPKGPMRVCCSTCVRECVCVCLCVHTRVLLQWTRLWGRGAGGHGLASWPRGWGLRAAHLRLVDFSTRINTMKNSSTATTKPNRSMHMPEFDEVFLAWYSRTQFTHSAF